MEQLPGIAWERGDAQHSGQRGRTGEPAGVGHSRSIGAGPWRAPPGLHRAGCPAFGLFLIPELKKVEVFFMKGPDKQMIILLLACPEG